MNAPQTTKLSLALAEGDSLRDAGRLQEALARYREAALADPESPEPHFKLGVALEALDDREAAEAAYRRAMSLAGGCHVDSACNLGVLLQAEKRPAEAEQVFRQVLADSPDHVDVHQNLARLCFEQNRYPEALYLSRRATALGPDSAMAHYNLGVVLAQQQRPREAEDALRRALAADPASTQAWMRLGYVLSYSGRHAEAQEAYEKAIAIDPANGSAWRALMFFTNVRSVDRAEAFALHRRFNETICRETLGLPLRTPEPLRKNDRLRIGLVSGDLRRHSVGYFVEGLLKAIDRQAFEIFAYFNGPKADDKTALLSQYTDCWRNIHEMSDERVAAFVRNDRIDVLVDLSGHTSHNRLAVFAMRVAPVQLTWIGYPNTTGLDQMDYRITDAVADPPGLTDDDYSETLWRLPRPFLAYTPAPDAPAISPPPVLQRGYVTFGSFNSRAKIDVETIELWSRVLVAVPRSRLLIKSPFGLNEEAARDLLRAQFAGHGVDPGRIEMRSGEGAYTDHLAAYADIDIGLDPYPYNGTTTTCEAMWMGVPVVTLAGDRHAARVGASLLQAVGLPELIAQDPDEFSRIAAGLAADLQRLEVLRLGLESGLRERMRQSPLTDSADMARQVGQAWQEMWRAANAMPVRTDDPDLTVRIADDVRVRVPASPASITTWTLLEQEDWFEDEIRFLREICEPTWQALDVGANHGVYSLALAARGVQRIWAFEPMPEPRARFARSIVDNGYQKLIQLLPIGLADRRQRTSFCQTGNSELSHLDKASDATPPEQLVEIELETLDDQLGGVIPAEARIDFVKLDAEKMEVAIIDGGKRFFADQSPLVMFEYRDDTETNDELLAALRDYGYRFYRLAPGLQALVPLTDETSDSGDAFRLNLFACKADRAERLAAAGRLVTAVPADWIERPLPREWFDAFLAAPEIPRELADRWRSFDLGTPYGRALLAWLGSRQPRLEATTRLGLLYQCIVEIGRAGKDSHLATAALTIRALADLGERTQALTVGLDASERLPPDDRFPLDRPAPCPWPDIDSRDDGEDYAAYLQRSIREFLLRRRAHSGCFLADYWAQINAALRSPFASRELIRLAVLTSVKRHRRLSLPREARIFQDAPDSRNAELWSAIAEGWGIVDPEAPTEPIRLHVGGKEQRAGWKILNVSAGPGVDYALDIRDLSSLASGSCAEIYASHVLEHVGQRDFRSVVGELYRLLVTGGKLYISVPDLDVLCRLFIRPGASTAHRAVIMRMIFGGQIDPYDFHVVGLTYDFLFEALSNAGFSTVRRVERFGIFDDTSDLEAFGERISLNLIATR